MKRLILIPARKGSKGLPGKNTKLLNGKPLISYTIEFALSIKRNDDVICISTNDDLVINIARRNYNLEVDFKRPEGLSTDRAGSEDVISHAIKFYEDQDVFFESIVLLQPTSPLRIITDFENVVQVFEDCDMAVTVKNIKESPYFTLFEENENGYLQRIKQGNFATRQDCPPVFAYNGSIYLIRIASLRQSSIQNFKKVRKVLMPNERSIDIDEMADWILAEYFLNKFNDENS